MRLNRLPGLLIGMAIVLRPAFAHALSFTAEELFSIPFGAEKEKLGARIEGGHFLIPRDFTIDSAGHFYIYDTHKHRIARYSPEGRFEMEFRYLPTAGQVFAHADSDRNLWLLLSDPTRGIYCGVYDSRGKLLRSSIFSQYNRFRLQADSDFVLHVILSSTKRSGAQTFLMDEETLRLKKLDIPPPPQDHHRVRRSDRTYFIDAVPSASKDDQDRVNRVTDESRRPIGDIRGAVIYMTDAGEIYTRIGTRDVRVYDVDGSQLGKLRLSGLPSACEAIRFDALGNIYQLDGIPFSDGSYSEDISGMRLVRWRRQ